MFRVLAIVEILHYRRLPVPDPVQNHPLTNKVILEATMISMKYSQEPTCLQVMQICTQMTCHAQFASVHSPFPSDLRHW